MDGIRNRIEHQASEILRACYPGATRSIFACDYKYLAIEIIGAPEGIRTSDLCLRSAIFLFFPSLPEIASGYLAG